MQPQPFMHMLPAVDTESACLPHLPGPLLIAVLDWLGDAAEVIRAATACKALWMVARHARFSKVHRLGISAFHASLQHHISRLAVQFPCIEQLNIAGCSALPESWLQPALHWPVQQLNVPQLWHWDGSICLPVWAGTLTQLVANDTSLPLVAMGRQLPNVPDGSKPVIQPPAAARQSIDSVSVPGQQPSHQQQLQQQQLQATPAQASQLQWAMQTGNLQHLQLRGLVTNPVRCTSHGRTNCDCQEDTLLSVLLHNNTGITHLDLAGNTCLPNPLLDWAFTSCPNLRTLNLSGCELASPSYVKNWCPRLQNLILQGTAISDVLLTSMTIGLPGLTMLNINCCRQVSGIGLKSLASSPSVTSGRLRHLDLGRLTRADAHHLALLMEAWGTGVAASCRQCHFCTRSSSSSHRHAAAACSGKAASNVLPQLHLCLSHTGATDDSVITALLKAALVPASASSIAAARGDGSKCREFSGTAISQDNLQHEPAQCQQLQADALQAGIADVIDQFCSCLSLSSPLELAKHAARPAATVLGPDVSPGCQFVLRRLELAGCNRISGFMLLQLFSSGVLAGLRVLDLTDMEALRQPSSNGTAHQLQLAKQTNALYQRAAAASERVQNQGVSGANAAAHADAALAVPDSQLAQLFSHTGQMLTKLSLDGCFVDDCTATYIANRCSQLRELSVVGCKGLGNSGLIAFAKVGSSGGGGGSSASNSSTASSSSSGGLLSLSLGGASGRWSEAVALSGLTSLTSLKLLRRSLVRDADLAPILATNKGLRSLSLAGCYSLTDNLFELATRAAAAANLATAAVDAAASSGGSVIGPVGMLNRDSISVDDRAHNMHGDGSHTGRETSQPGAAGCCGAKTSRLWPLPPTSHSSMVSGASGTCRLRPLPSVGNCSIANGLQELRQLCLTACDSMHGSSIPLLRGLQHLRVSFCASFSMPAVQQLVVGCTRLCLLELPESLGNSFKGNSGSNVGSSRTYGRKSSQGPVAVSSNRQQAVVNGTSGDSGNGCREFSAWQGGGRFAPAERMPRQGPGGHLHGLKVVCLK